MIKTTRIVSTLVVACLLLQGCALWPFPAHPPAAVPSWSCPSTEGVAQVPLDCDASVEAALSVLDPDHADIESIRFEYGPCPCQPEALCDCAIHYLGTVTVSFVDGPPAVVSVTGFTGQPVATLE
jgi:hypothetical protein